MNGSQNDHKRRKDIESKRIMKVLQFRMVSKIVDKIGKIMKVGKIMLVGRFMKF